MSKFIIECPYCESCYRVLSRLQCAELEPIPEKQMLQGAQ